MGYVTKYGSFWGAIPTTNGQVHWVAPSASYTVEGRTYIASDANDGLSPERAVLTLAQAITNATASVNDVIVLLPGAHSWSAQVNVSKAGLTITGLPGGKGHQQRQRTSVTISAADEIMGITAARVEIAYLHFVAVTAQACIEISNAGDYAHIHDCSFDMFTAVASTSTVGIQSIGTSSGVTNLLVEDCYFETLGAQGAYMDLPDVAYSVIRRIITRHTGSTALANGFLAATGLLDVLFENIRMLSGTSAVVTDSFDVTGSTTDGGLQLHDVYLSKGIGVPNGSADADVWVSPVGNVQVAIDADGASSIINVINAS